MFEEINHIVSVLESGGIILYPTDTVWGLGCDATNPIAVAKIFTIKQRVANKSMIVLLPDAKSILHYVAQPHPDIIAIIQHFETPTTVIYENGIGFANNVLAEDGSIGIRVTLDPFCKTLLKRFRKPIVSTSANISGEKSPQIFTDISHAIISSVDYVVAYRQNDNRYALPSAIVKINNNGSVETLR
jgi:L-threonylcarbamoyladenylate synthase